jgi:hypothetical protein
MEPHTALSCSQTLPLVTEVLAEIQIAVCGRSGFLSWNECCSIPADEIDHMRRSWRHRDEADLPVDGVRWDPKAIDANGGEVPVSARQTRVGRYETAIDLAYRDRLNVSLRDPEHSLMKTLGWQPDYLAEIRGGNTGYSDLSGHLALVRIQRVRSAFRRYRHAQGLNQTGATLPELPTWRTASRCSRSAAPCQIRGHRLPCRFLRGAGL